MKRMLVVLVVIAAPLALAACSGGGSSESSGQGGGGGGSIAGPASGDSSSDGPARSAAALETPAKVGGDRSSLPSAGPRIIQTARLAVTVPRHGFEDAVAEARDAAGALGGFVVSSTRHDGSGDRVTSGTLVLRVPEESYADAMSRLRDLGKVTSREERGQDVSAEFVDLDARRRNLEAVEAQLLKLLNRAGSVSAALAVQSKLDDVQLQLEQVRGRLRFLDDQTAFATITLSLREHPPAAAPKDDDGGVVDAWSEGAHAFVHVAARTFVVVATIAPILLILGLAALAWRIVARRRLVPRSETD